MPGDLPNAVLFACTQNVIRSPMAAAIMKHFYGHRVYRGLGGVRPGEPDPFIATVLDEIGIDLDKHRPHDFADLEDSSFDVAISLSPEAHHWALELTRTMAIETEYWPTMDPSATFGSREQILDATGQCAMGLEGGSGRAVRRLGARGVRSEWRVSRASADVQFADSAVMPVHTRASRGSLVAPRPTRKDSWRKKNYWNLRAR